MAQSKGRNISQDRKRVAGGQYHEVAYMKEKLGITSQQLSGAIRAVGNDRKKIESYLKQRK
ncbi:MAG: DUF3606 domain-containing protein [Chitinophagaceae bacterium]|nr:DUF3606 domain-containing protein [Chitinophagaceae bacterium]